MKVTVPSAREGATAIPSPLPAGDPEGLEDFATSRGFTPEFLAEYGIHVAGEDEWQPGWYAIPYPHLSGVWYNRYRNPSSHGTKYLTPPGAGAHLYNPLHLGPQTEEVWFTEGELDALSLIYIGLPAIGITGVHGFKAVWKLLFEHATVVAAMDNDEQGHEAASRLANAFQRGVIFRLPETYNDLNQWLVEEGPDAMLATIHEFREQEGIA